MSKPVKQYGRPVKAAPAPKPKAAPAPAPEIVRPIGNRARPAAVTKRDEEKEEAEITPTFVGACAGVLLAVAGGAYMVLGDRSASILAAQTGPAYESVVDDECGKTWRKGLSNVDELHCYMTTHIKRLCDPREHRHLIATIGRFNKDYMVYNDRLMAAGMQSAFSARMNSTEIGMQGARVTAKMSDQNASGEEQAAELEKMTKMVDGVLAAPHAIMAEKRNQIPQYELPKHMKPLIDLGLITQADFPGDQPNWIVEAFKIAKPGKSECNP